MSDNLDTTFETPETEEGVRRANPSWYIDRKSSTILMIIKLAEGLSKLCLAILGAIMLQSVVSALNRIFQEGGESVAFLIMAGGKKILLLGSLSVHPQETYPEDVDILILPYQGNNDLPARAKEVLARIRPKSVLLSHFDNAFPPMSRDVNLRPLKRMMDETYPGIRVVKPEAGKTIDF